MELKRVNEKNQLVLNPVVIDVQQEAARTTSDVHFMAANTEIIGIDDMRKKHTIPVFARDNESTISHQEFVQTISYVTEQIFRGEQVLTPAVRVSHPIKGRIPSAVGKPAKELLEHEKTIYHERIAFMVEIPHIHTYINNQKLNLTVGSVRSYSEQNLFSKKSIEKFKIFIGFKNMVCCNLCIATDGLKDDLRVSSIDELQLRTTELFLNYNKDKHLETL